MCVCVCLYWSRRVLNDSWLKPQESYQNYKVLVDTCYNAITIMHTT